MLEFLCAVPLVAGLLSECTPAPLSVGYVEGEYVLLAPLEVAEVRQVLVRRGDRVEEGVPLVNVEDDDARIAVDNAAAALRQAKANLANLKEGKRPEEIRVLEATLHSAEAQSQEAERVFKRQNDLLKRGIVSTASFDEAKTALDIARAKVDELKANLTVARLPARENEIVASEKQVEQAAAALERAEWLLQKRVLKAPAKGEISDVIRRVGEVAGPSAPVLSFLPDGAVKLKVYIPQTALSSVTVDSVLSVRCDGCDAGLKARVSYVARSPEFTPPVIYSLQNRQKLVYLVEARPLDGATALKPGQIVDVELDGMDQ
ncbi:MAG: HlyD family secretion protein [Hyphomicrobiales bacterium]|nr:MAG: HlyD family secretion protein [Hyphomicrobiales bacterium]